VYDNDVLDVIDELLTRLQEKFRLPTLDDLLSILGLLVRSNRVLDDAILVLSENDDFLLLHELLSCIDDVDILDLFLNEPLLPSSALDAINISEILKGFKMKGGLII